MPPMYCRSFEKKEYVPEHEIPARVLRMQENLLICQRYSGNDQFSELKEMFAQGMSKYDIAKAMSK